ncbi:7024_t:CDS:2, partial [Paraglomus brasilianum]
KPITDRTYQIRVHIQCVGHSIADDPSYNHQSAWGPSTNKGGLDQETTAKANLANDNENVDFLIGSCDFGPNYFQLVDFRSALFQASPARAEQKARLLYNLSISALLKPSRTDT